MKIDYNYLDYLRTFDEKVPYNFDQKQSKPFVGALFEINSCKYFAPLSSPKPKHMKMKNNIDFLKLDNGRLGAINFNNMVPVTSKNVIIINLYREYIKLEDGKYPKTIKRSNILVKS